MRCFDVPSTREPYSTESYLDPTDGRFDTRLNLTYEGEFIGIDFPHHGRNCYAYLLASYGHTEVEVQGSGDSVGSGGGEVIVLDSGDRGGGDVRLVAVPVFDLVTVQLYESFTHAMYRTVVQGADPAAYLEAWAEAFYTGWNVRFSEYDRDGRSGSRILKDVMIAVEPARLVIGLGNAWACCPPPPGSGPLPVEDLGHRRNAFFWPEVVGKARGSLAARGQAFRGVVFWEAAADGDVPSGESEALYFARECNKFLNTRRTITGQRTV